MSNKTIINDFKKEMGWNEPFTPVFAEIHVNELMDKAREEVKQKVNEEIDKLVNKNKNKRDNLDKIIKNQSATEIDKRIWVGYKAEVGILKELEREISKP